MGPAAVTGWLEPGMAIGFVSAVPVLVVATAALVGASAAMFWRRRAASGVDRAINTDNEQISPLTDREQVAGVLRENGGRMHQSAIVEATGWSKSKVSTVLSEMSDQGRVTKLRLGRENIISLPGHEPDAARSPYDRRG